MGFPESVLTSDEKVVLHLHPHWRMLVRPAVVTVLAVGAVVATWLLPPAVGWATPLLLGVAVLALVLVGWLAVVPWLRWKTTHYVFTNERVLLREGILSRHGRDVPIGRINDMSFSHGVVDRMFGCGTLTIESTGDRGQVVLTDVPDVEKTQSVLYELVEGDRDQHTFGDDDREAIISAVGDPAPAQTQA